MVGSGIHRKCSSRWAAMPGVLAGLIAGLGGSDLRADPVVYTAGHADLSVAFVNGAFEWNYKFDFDAVLDGVETNAVVFKPAGSVVTVVPESAELAAPISLPFLGLGSGDPLWLLPVNQIDDVPWVGWSTEELVVNQWSGPISVSLEEVGGPGDFAVWGSAAGGGLTSFLSTIEGFNPGLDLPLGSHLHLATGFTEPGIYDVTLRATGTLAAGGTVTGLGTFRFHVEPLPALLLPGDANEDGVVDDLDLLIVQQNLGLSSATWADGDFDMDGRVTLYDAYLLFKFYESSSSGTAAGLMVIPEPGSVVMLAAAGAGLMFRRRR